MERKIKESKKFFEPAVHKMNSNAIREITWNKIIMKIKISTFRGFI